MERREGMRGRGTRHAMVPRTYAHPLADAGRFRSAQARTRYGCVRLNGEEGIVEARSAARHAVAQRSSAGDLPCQARPRGFDVVAGRSMRASPREPVGCTPMTTQTQFLGERGERMAERWLRERGWAILDRRFRSGHRDIDLVAERDDVVAFVEVKARSGTRCGEPVEAVTWRKQRELVRSALVWLDHHGRPDRSYGFDVIGVVIQGDRVRIRHLENAFGRAVRA